MPEKAGRLLYKQQLSKGKVGFASEDEAKKTVIPSLNKLNSKQKTYRFGLPPGNALGGIECGGGGSDDVGARE